VEILHEAKWEKVARGSARLDFTILRDIFLLIHASGSQ